MALPVNERKEAPAHPRKAYINCNVSPLETTDEPIEQSMKQQSKKGQLVEMRGATVAVLILQLPLLSLFHCKTENAFHLSDKEFLFKRRGLKYDKQQNHCLV
jgi:hypothetical protein